MTPDLRRAEEAVEKGCVNCRGKLYVVVEEWKDGDMVVPCPACTPPTGERA
jgi:hypothetical protein